MKLTQRGSTWYLDLRLNGVRKRISTGTSDHSVAQSKVPELMKGILEESASGEPSGFSLADGFQKLFKEEWNQTKDVAGLTTRVAEIEAFFKPDTPLVDIGRDELIDLQYHFQQGTGKWGKDASPATVNRKMAVMNKLLNVAYTDWRIIPVLPKVRPMRVSSGRNRYLTDTEIAGLYEHTGVRMHDVWKFLIETGVRMGEFINLRWKNIDLDEGYLHLEDDSDLSMKGGRYLSLPLASTMRVILTERRTRGLSTPFEGITRMVVRREWDKARKAMNLEHDHGFVPHALRHTCATRLILAGVPTSSVQKWLGHASLETTTKYLDENAADLKQHTTAVEVDLPKQRLRSV